MLVHCIQDPTIPSSHAHALFSALLEPYLPPFPFTAEDIRPTNLKQTHDHYKEMVAAQEARTKVREGLVKEEVLENYGTSWAFEREGKGKVRHVGEWACFLGDLSLGLTMFNRDAVGRAHGYCADGGSHGSRWGVFRPAQGCIIKIKDYSGRDRVNLGFEHGA